MPMCHSHSRYLSAQVTKFCCFCINSGSGHMLLERTLGYRVTTRFSFRMKILSVAFVFLVVLTLSSAIAGLNNEVSSVWIPEHRCTERIHSDKCDSRECMKKCWKKLQGGRGRCLLNRCICSFYCHGPPT